MSCFNDGGVCHGPLLRAKNLPDGRVEVLMCGPSSAVAELSQWLWQGPEGARVTHVTLETLDAHHHAPDHFSTY